MTNCAETLVFLKDYLVKSSCPSGRHNSIPHNVNLTVKRVSNSKFLRMGGSTPPPTPSPSLRVSSTGGCGGEAFPPPNPPTSPPKVLTINTISNNKNSGFMFFRALVIDTQKWAQKLCMLHTQLIFVHYLPPQTKNPR